MNIVTATASEGLRTAFTEQLAGQLFWAVVVAFALAMLVSVWAIVRGGRLTYDEQVEFLEGYLGHEKEPSGPTEGPDGSRRGLS